MNQQNQASGYPSSVPMKRKRGRPRKDESAVQGENTPVLPGSGNFLNSNQATGTTDDRNEEMVGRMVTGVIEGAFSAGYLLNVKVADADAYLRGLVFLPGQVAPVTAENDVAPHVEMIQRKEIPITVLNPRTVTHGSVPSSAQCSKQPSEPELQVPNSQEQVITIEMHSGTSVSPENQSAPTMVPVADLSKNETSISSGGIPQGISESGHENQSPSIMSELECEKPVRQVESLHEPEASTQVKEAGADGGATKDSGPASETINLVPTIETIDKKLRMGQQAVPSEHKPNEQIHDEKNTSNIELNQIPVSAKPESMPSEQVSESVDNFVEKQASPKTDVLGDAETKLATTEMLSKIGTSNSNGKPSTGVGNGLDVGSNHALETSQPDLILSEQIGKSVPSESKFSSEGCAFQEKSDPQNCSSFDAISKVDVNQPTE